MAAARATHVDDAVARLLERRGWRVQRQCDHGKGKNGGQAFYKIVAHEDGAPVNTSAQDASALVSRGRSVCDRWSSSRRRRQGGGRSLARTRRNDPSR